MEQGKQQAWQAAGQAARQAIQVQDIKRTLFWLLIEVN
jgi:hypothetical protein